MQGWAAAIAPSGKKSEPRSRRLGPFAGRRDERRSGGGQWIDRKRRLLERLPPGRNQCFHCGQIGGFVMSRIVAQLGFRQLEHSICCAQPAFLEEHKSAGQLDQTLEEIPVGSTAVQQPEIFEDVMGLMESLTVEAVEIGEISRIQSPSRKPCHPSGDDGALVCHSPTLPQIRPSGG